MGGTTMTTEKGLYEKYEVYDSNTGEPVEELCFVLIPSKDPAAVVALGAYAAATENKILAKDIYDWVGKGDEQ